MAHRRSSSNEDVPFLEPPHSHNPSNISLLAAVPRTMLAQLPSELHPHIWSLQESTSVLYASHTRLQSLLASRLDRLTLLAGTFDISESPFFNYTNQVTAERSYLTDDAYPDWRQKLKCNMRTLSPYSDKRITFRGENIAIQDWIDRLSTVAETRSDTAKEMEVPEFDEVVKELQMSQAPTPTPLNSPLVNASEDSAVDSKGLAKGLQQLRPESPGQSLSGVLRATGSSC